MLSGKIDIHWPGYSHLNCIRISIYINEKWEGSVIKLYQHGRRELFCTDVRQNDWWSCAPWDLKFKYSKKLKSVYPCIKHECAGSQTNKWIVFSYKKYFCNCKVCTVKALFVHVSSERDTFWEARCLKDGSALSKKELSLVAQAENFNTEYLHLFLKDFFKFSFFYVKPTTPWSKSTYTKWTLGKKAWLQFWLFPSTLSNVTWDKSSN